MKSEEIKKNLALVRERKFRILEDLRLAEEMYFPNEIEFRKAKLLRMYKRLQHEERILRNMNKVETVDIPVSGELVIKTTQTSQRSLFKYFLPSKRREEILGDLYETRKSMIEDGFSWWKIWLMISIHKFWIVIGLFRLKLSDFGNPKKRIDKTDLN